MNFDAMAGIFRALGDPHRLKVMQFLATSDPGCCRAGDGVCACDIQTLLGLAQPTVSHHMKVLTEAGLITAEKRGRWMYYALNGSGLELARKELLALLVAAPVPSAEAV